MKVLIAHCRYQQPGGEDIVAAAEARLLRRHGHTLRFYERDNHDIDHMSQMQLASQSIWSRRTSHDMGNLLAEFRPDIVHVHNTFPLISPSLYWTAERMGIPVVQTLHNFRLLCPQALLLREGRVCEDCVGKLPWRGVAHKCYRDSIAASGVIALMLGIHRTLGSFRDKVTRYIATNQFCADKFVSGGLPAGKMVVKPHFVDLPAPPKGARSGPLYVGRLAPEKGIDTMLKAMAKVPGVTLTVIGDGPERRSVAAHKSVSALGWQDSLAIYEHMRRASYLVIPSIWYEIGPLTLIEAFGNGLPVIASRIGPLGESVEEGETGLLFEPGSPEDLAKKIAWAEDNPEKMRKMGESARMVYETKYTAEKNYQQLIAIYADALATLRVGSKFESSKMRAQRPNS